MSDRLAAEQKNRNADSRASWELARSHRRRVTDLLLRAAGAADGRLAVLGVGNANDLNLKRLARAYSRIDLFDIDTAAMRAAITVQGAGDLPVRVQGPHDLTGVWDRLEALAKATNRESARAELLDEAVEPSPPTDERYGVVASTCLLSQLIDSVYQTLGHEEHEVAFAVRQGHLRLIADLLKPAGTGVLVTDFVSSDTAPTLPRLGPAELPGELTRMIEAGNFFTGLNPFALTERLAEQVEPLRIDPASIDRQMPWLWDFGPRVYAVTAITFHKDP